MKKSLILLFAATLLCGVLSCGDTASSGVLTGNPFVDECFAFNPKTNHTYIKNRDYGILRELSSEEKEEIIQTVIEECPKSICRYDYGSINYGVRLVDSSTGEVFTGYDNYYGGYSYIYKNAVEGCYKDFFSDPYTLPYVRCFYNEGNDYSFVSARYYPDKPFITEFRKMQADNENLINPESWMAPFNGAGGSAEGHFIRPVRD